MFLQVRERVCVCACVWVRLHTVARGRQSKAQNLSSSTRAAVVPQATVSVDTETMLRSLEDLWNRHCCGPVSAKSFI